MLTFRVLAYWQGAQCLLLESWHIGRELNAYTPRQMVWYSTHWYYTDGVCMWQGLTFEVLAHWNITPQTHDMIFHPVILYWRCLFVAGLAPGSPVLIPSSTSLMLRSSERAASTIFIKSLGWLVQGANSQHPGHKAGPLPIEPRGRYSGHCRTYGRT